MASTTPHIIIIGAGLGGLMLAQALRKRGITFEVFERDEHENARQQGWALGLHRYGNAEAWIEIIRLILTTVFFPRSNLAYLMTSRP